MVVLDNEKLTAHTIESKAAGTRRSATHPPATSKSRSLKSDLPVWTNEVVFKTCLVPTYIEHYGASLDPWDSEGHLDLAKEVVASRYPKIKYDPQPGIRDGLDYQVCILRCILSRFRIYFH
jgi:hypothetical protein